MFLCKHIVQENVDWKKFTSDAEVQSVVRRSLKQQSTSFFASGVQKLADGWDNCLNEFGQYVDKSNLLCYHYRL